MKIVAISGWKGSGKDMVSDYLTTRKGFSKLSFANPLKDIASALFNVPRAHFDDRDFKESPILSLPVDPADEFSRTVCYMIAGHFRTADGGKMPGNFWFDEKTGRGISTSASGEYIPLFHTPRSLAVLVGSSLRAGSSAFWVAKAVEQAKKNPDGIYVISDLRFKSEIAQLKAAAGAENVISIRIERFESTDQTDPSERDMDDFAFDFVINNKESEGKTRNEVYEQVIEALTDAGVLKSEPLVSSS